MTPSVNNHGPAVPHDPEVAYPVANIPAGILLENFMNPCSRQSKAES
jgi:hypothetical protein